ncbi:unnamed protein product [Ambrosiozyma monospora]|uniref:Unnamed protein product n=1 Tax=Ambrosiozyma monospora TaxID=43982 RepID=A0ACB5U7M1_AMBMO|nr:unnamed protein product [Ambrosiozyma monospora]
MASEELTLSIRGPLVVFFTQKDIHSHAEINSRDSEARKCSHDIVNWDDNIYLSIMQMKSKETKFHMSFHLITSIRNRSKPGRTRGPRHLQGPAGPKFYHSFGEWMAVERKPSFFMKGSSVSVIGV